jgi:hypothetical protein
MMAAAKKVKKVVNSYRASFYVSLGLFTLTYAVACGVVAACRCKFW